MSYLFWQLFAYFHGLSVSCLHYGITRELVIRSFLLNSERDFTFAEMNDKSTSKMPLGGVITCATALQLPPSIPERVIHNYCNIFITLCVLETLITYNRGHQLYISRNRAFFVSLRKTEVAWEAELSCNTRKLINVVFHHEAKHHILSCSIK